MIKTWSYSRLLDFESCPLKAKLKYVDKIPDLKPRTAADRGTAIHLEAENYVNGTLPTLPPSLNKLAPQFYSLKEHYRQKHVSLEGEWGFNHEWKPTEYRTAWGRIKADAVCTISPTTAVVIDFKTGKKFGNEIKHGEQLELYALATFIRNPSLQTVEAELWYLDIDEITSINLTRKQSLTRSLKLFDKRAHFMTNATRFRATPNFNSCKYCPYKDTEHCHEGV